MAELLVFNKRHAGISHFAQVVAWNFGGQSHCNPAGTIEQGKGQTRRKLLGLFGGAVVIGNEVDGSHVNFIHQQAGDAGQTRLGVAHGGRTIAIAAAKVALPINQRIPLRKILGHSHQRVIRGTVAMGVITAQYIAHHARTFNRLGCISVVRSAVAQTHTFHGIQNTPLHGLLTIAHIGQSTAFYY